MRKDKKMLRHSLLGRSLLVFGLAGTVALGAACSSGPAYGDLGLDSAKLGEKTTVIEGDLADQAQVFESKLVFPGSAWSVLGSKRAGDILVGDRAESGTGNPSGFLRKVTAVTKNGDEVVVTTEPATLDEAVESMNFSAKIQTPALTAKGPVSGTGGVGIQGGGKPMQVVDFSGKQILDWTGDVALDTNQKVGFHAVATANTGVVNFTPEWDVGADVGFFKVKGFHLIGTGTLDAVLEVDAKLDLTTNIDSQTFTQIVAKKIFKSQSTTIAEYKYNAGKLKVGPLPIPLTGHFVATLQCDFQWGGSSQVTFGGNAKASVTAGLKYENDKMSPVFAKSAELNQTTAPAWTLDGLTKIKCTIRPEFGLNLYDMASGRVWAEGYVDVGGKLTCGGKNGSGQETGVVNGNIGAGVTAGVSAKVDVFGLKKWEKECTLFSIDKAADYTRTFVLPGGPNATCTPMPQGYERETPVAAPELCFGGTGGGGATPPPPPGDDGGIAGSCTHGVCEVGDKLGSACNACTAKVCAKDAYCCTTYWGPSCFAAVETECGMKCQ